MITLHNESVGDRWMRLLPDCKGNAVELLDRIERDLGQAGLPGVFNTQDTLAGNSLKGMGGDRRDALVVGNQRFKEFQIVIAGWDYGTYLHVVRFVVSSPKLAGSLKRKAMFNKDQDNRYKPGAELNVLDSAELDAWISVTDFCLRQAIESLIEDDEKVRDPWDLLTFD